MQDFGGKTLRKRPRGRTSHRWEDNIKMDLQKVECGFMGWIELVRIETGGEHL
jgi:hypothetical protein